MTRFAQFVLLSLTLTFSAVLAHAAAPAATVVLTNNDVLQGTVVQNDGEVLVLEHPILGVIQLPAASIAKLVVTPEGDPTPVVAEPEINVEATQPADAPAEAEAAAEEAVAETEPAPWDLRLEIGLDGSDGNTERFSGRFERL